MLDLVRRPRPRAATALIRLQNGQIWTLLTTMAELKGSRGKGRLHPAARRPARRQSGCQNLEGIARRGGNRAARLKTSPTCSLSVAAKAASRSALGCASSACPPSSLRGNARAGDFLAQPLLNRSACHEPVWYDHLPYIDFPKNWPVFSPKDKIGDWLEMYTRSWS